MNITFIPARDLKPRYQVLGHFYNLKLRAEEPQKCRSVLEISALGTASNSAADAIFVMMNPGSSRPLEELNTTVTVNQVAGMPAQLVRTVPDMTQYQVMRVMHYMGWQHVRVINLSDLRDPKSGSFAQRYAQLENEFGAKDHSIFSPRRSAQLKQHMIRKRGAPIVCAWGVSDDLNPLIERARQVLELEQQVTGLSKSPGVWKYFHPLPSLQRQKEEWVTQILRKLECRTLCSS
ncbi:DUF1643 domain-containing protein [Achromobacter sp. Bel]|uniref:DUF1643 domain-containing protein n=1 Tax=Achromobacter sp. Bel TaxID=2727415 RepID=UPI00145DDAB0|nr:DUF1643 domain-containing protein [Achromobacter sp. Bel]NMK44796.1 DUF1643 domain-containing protein [Achromobacter sp. Bel]